MSAGIRKQKAVNSLLMRYDSIVGKARSCRSNDALHSHLLNCSW